MVLQVLRVCVNSYIFHKHLPDLILSKANDKGKCYREVVARFNDTIHIIQHILLTFYL